MQQGGLKFEPARRNEVADSRQITYRQILIENVSSRFCDGCLFSKKEGRILSSGKRKDLGIFVATIYEKEFELNFAIIVSLLQILFREVFSCISWRSLKNLFAGET